MSFTICHDCRDVYQSSDATTVSIRCETRTVTAYVCPGCARERRGYARTVEIENDELRAIAGHHKGELVRLVLATEENNQ